MSSVSGRIYTFWLYSMLFERGLMKQMIENSYFALIPTNCSRATIVLMLLTFCVCVFSRFCRRHHPPNWAVIASSRSAPVSPPRWSKADSVGSRLNECASHAGWRFWQKILHTFTNIPYFWHFFFTSLSQSQFTSCLPNFSRTNKVPVHPERLLR